MMGATSASEVTILVVDDNEANCALAQATLEDEGYRVVVARGGIPGLEAFESHRPDCVLLDVRMPDLDGFAVCQRIRALPGGADAPIVFLTALRDVDTFDQALRVGGDDFLTKPVRPTELVLRVQAALKLRQVRDERRELYALLRQQRDDLLRATLLKEQLTAFLVHDLKNPVTGMQLVADLILRDTGASQRTRDGAARIRDDAAGLLRMILDLLDISKSDEGRLVLHPSAVALPELAAEVLAEFAARAAPRRVALAADVEVETIEADAGLLRRILENLLDNAVRHAPRDSTVRVRAFEDDTHVELQVRDEGAGVPPTLRERIFDRFIQAEDDAGARRAGRGLGLAFCKLVVEAHGGTIGVEDAHPGSIFRVRLPRPLSAEPSHGA